ncbi:MAG: hypothetical protein KBS80_00335 [Bacteroidales bacterium]|nr:hypothetical protein [Candidatus Cryptobacteroides choladohippi]
MISIIICSRNENISPALRKNIDETIGTEYEFVIIDNSLGKYSIFEAYNEGVARARGNLLCFVHDDVMFRTKEWGQNIENLFINNHDMGVVGVAGSHFMPKVPMYWWSSPFISQYNLENDNGQIKENSTQDYFHDNLAEVAVVDGLCMFIPAELFNTISFDDKTFSGFHAYDMDICMQVQSLGKKVYVSNVFLIEHFWSEKSFENKKYMALLDNNLKLYFNKWKECLPITRGLDEPQIVLDRVNNLCLSAYSGKMARASYAYRLGKTFLRPLKFLAGKKYQ